MKEIDYKQRAMDLAKDNIKVVTDNASLKVENKALKEQLRLGGVSGSALTDILKSDSVYTLARYGFKNQEKTGIDNHEDDGFYELYKICVKLREH